MDEKKGRVGSSGSSTSSAVSSKIPLTSSQKAGLKFPVGLIQANLVSSMSSEKSAPVYMAAVLEYLTTELLDVAGKQLQEKDDNCITPEHLYQAIVNDPELMKVVTAAKEHNDEDAIEKKKEIKKRKMKNVKRNQEEEEQCVDVKKKAKLEQ